MQQQRRCIMVLGSILAISNCTTNDHPAPIEQLNSPKVHKALKTQRVTSKNYKVKKGDTLYSIAFGSGLDYQQIAKLNSISAPYRIYPGQVLSLPSSKNRQSAKTDSQTGRTSKNATNQAVDPPKKQGYGESPNKNLTITTTSESKGQEQTTWRWPTQGKLIKRFSLGPEGNKGIDISNKEGTAIVAAADGKVVYTGNALRGYGNLIIVKHSEDYLSAYAHNSQVLVKEQQQVQAGQRIALMGSSGAPQVMLHFEVRYQGISVDPLRYLPKKIK